MYILKTMKYATTQTLSFTMYLHFYTSFTNMIIIKSFHYHAKLYIWLSMEMQSPLSF